MCPALQPPNICPKQELEEMDMSAPENRNTGNLETSSIVEKSEMKATVNGQNKLAVACQEISKFKEDITMKLSMKITKNTPVKILGGLALGALLLGATALTQGTNNPVTGELNMGPAAPVTLGGGIPDDEWMFNSPYHQDFSNGSSVEVRVTPSTVQGIPDDQWMFNSPFHQDFSAVGKLGVETAAVTIQGITDFEEPYVNAVRPSSDLGGGITDFEEPYVNGV